MEKNNQSKKFNNKFTKKRVKHEVTIKNDDGTTTSIKTCADCSFKTTCNRRSAVYRGGKLHSCTVRCSEFA